MSDEHQIHQLSRVVGGLEQAVRTLTETWARQDEKASEGRRELFTAVTGLRVDVTKLQRDVAPIAKLDERIDKLEAARNRAIGAVWGARAVIAAMGGAIGALLTKFGLK